MTSPVEQVKVHVTTTQPSKNYSKRRSELRNKLSESCDALYNNPVFGMLMVLLNNIHKLVVGMYMSRIDLQGTLLGLSQHIIANIQGLVPTSWGDLPDGTPCNLSGVKGCISTSLGGVGGDEARTS